MTNREAVLQVALKFLLAGIQGCIR